MSRTLSSLKVRLQWPQIYLPARRLKLLLMVVVLGLLWSVGPRFYFRCLEGNSSCLSEVHTPNGVHWEAVELRVDCLLLQLRDLMPTERRHKCNSGRKLTAPCARMRGGRRAARKKRRFVLVCPQPHP